MIGRRSLAAPPAQPPPWRFNQLQIRLILTGLIHAWSQLPAARRARGLEETAINEALVDELDREIQDQAEPWSVLGVVSVEKGVELTDHTGNHLEKRPDIALRMPRQWPTPQGRHCGAFVECKRIDRRHDRRISHYQKEGIYRFIEGKYAWQMATAFMVAYVFDGSALALLEPSEQRAEPGAEVGRTLHDRAFQASGHDVGPIELWHVWLQG